MGMVKGDMAEQSPGVSVSLTVTWGERGRDELNAALGQPCDDFHVLGANIGSSVLTYCDNEWVLEASADDAQDAEECIEEFMQRIVPLADRLAAMEGGEVGLDIALVTDDQVGIHLTLEAMIALSKMGAHVDFQCRPSG